MRFWRSFGEGRPALGRHRAEGFAGFRTERGLAGLVPRPCGSSAPAALAPPPLASRPPNPEVGPPGFPPIRSTPCGRPLAIPSCAACAASAFFACFASPSPFASQAASASFPVARGPPLASSCSRPSPPWRRPRRTRGSSGSRPSAPSTSCSPMAGISGSWTAPVARPGASRRPRPWCPGPTSPPTGSASPSPRRKPDPRRCMWLVSKGVTRRASPGTRAHPRPGDGAPTAPASSTAPAGSRPPRATVDSGPWPPRAAPPPSSPSPSASRGASRPTASTWR
jgi:hypothetical protein